MRLSTLSNNNKNKIMYQAKIQITEKMLWDLFPAVNPKIGRDKKNKNIVGFVYTYNKYADYFGIDTVLELRHFLAQLSIESDRFNAFEEYASGDAYDTRTDLGNTAARDGDGRKYKGRGPIQTTGGANYKLTGREIAKLPFLNEAEKALFVNDGLLKKPELLADPVWGTLAAMIYWTSRDLNMLCRPDHEKVTIKRFKKGTGWYNYTDSPIMCISFRVNGGWNGIEERKESYNKLSRTIV